MSEWQAKRLSEKQKKEMVKTISDEAYPKAVTATILINGVEFTTKVLTGKMVVDKFLSNKPTSRLELVRLDKSGDKMEFTRTNQNITITVTRIQKAEVLVEGPKIKPARGYSFFVHPEMPINPHTRERWASNEEYQEFCRDYPEELPKMRY